MRGLKTIEYKEKTTCIDLRLMRIRLRQSWLYLLLMHYNSHILEYPISRHSVFLHWCLFLVTDNIWNIWLQRVLSNCPWDTLRTRLTLISLGGGHGGPPPQSKYRAITRQRAKLLPRHFMTIFFRVPPHILTPNLWRPGVRFRSYVTLCTCTSDRKVAPKCDFVYSLSSYKYAYFYSQLLKLISFWFIVLQKVSATNFGEKKKEKKKGSKKQGNT